jgi:hypothetical protein
VAARPEVEQLEDLAPFTVRLVQRRQALNLEHVEEDERERDAPVAVEDLRERRSKEGSPSSPNATSSPSNTPSIGIAANSGSSSVMCQPRRLRTQ